jgi:hypothetical protein
MKALLLVTVMIAGLASTEAKARCGPGQILRVHLHRCVAANSALAHGFSRGRHPVRTIHARLAPPDPLPPAGPDACGVWHPNPSGWPGEWMRFGGFDKQWRWRL